MKHLIILFSIAFIFYSCSPENDDSNDTNPGQKLELTHYTLNYPSGTFAQNNFNGSMWTNTIKNSVQTVGIEYNSDNKMSKYIKYQTDGSINESYTFNFDGSGKITSVDEFYKSSIILPENFTRTLTYVGNSIKTTFPGINSSIYNEEFILNSDGLIKEYIRLDSENEFDSKLTFEYDDHKNCTTVELTVLINEVKQTVSYEYIYDTNPNPVFDHFNDNYLQSLIIHTRPFLFDYQIRNLIKTFGENNMIRTKYPENTSDYGKFLYEYKYNSSGYPEKVITKNVGTNETTVETEFFYK